MFNRKQLEVHLKFEKSKTGISKFPAFEYRQKYVRIAQNNWPLIFDRLRLFRTNISKAAALDGHLWTVISVQSSLTSGLVFEMQDRLSYRFVCLWSCLIRADLSSVSLRVKVSSNKLQLQIFSIWVVFLHFLPLKNIEAPWKTLEYLRSQGHDGGWKEKGS